MSESFLLPDLVKNLPTVTVANATERKILMSDNDGNLGLLPFVRASSTNINGAEAAGTELPIDSFISKYIAGKAIGHMLTDTDYSNSVVWRVAINDSIKLNMQQYVAVVVKNKGSLTSVWACISVLFVPAITSASALYWVTFTTGSSATDRNMTIKTLPINWV